MYKFNGGKGAIVCDKCRVIIAEHVAYTDHNCRPILCRKCKPPEPLNLTTFCDDCLGSGDLTEPCPTCGATGLKRGHD